MVKIPRIVVAGTNSGCGKTTVTMGILAALIKKGLKVQPFKAGPDYIDPMFHSFITGRKSRNLDTWMLEEDKVLYLFKKNTLDSEIAVVEGVMGIYDGFSGYNLEGSTAHIAKVIKAPIILVVNGDGVSLSLAALVKGFIDFDKDVNIKGVIINNISGEGHYKMLKAIIEQHLNISVLGYLRKSESYNLSSRHLGLVPSDEIDDLQNKITALVQEITKTIDLELLLKIANEADELPEKEFSLPEFDFSKSECRYRLAVAYDKAFNFYYQDNIDLLELLGMEIIYFSPLEDVRLPDNIHGIYIGGGYPELFVNELEQNQAMRNDIKGKIADGLPTYAECGGLMYLGNCIIDKDGQERMMVGAIPGMSQMTNKLQRFGYVELEISGENVLADGNSTVRAHEFHYSTTVVDSNYETCYKVIKQRRNNQSVSWKCGFKKGKLLAGYPHIHFWANIHLAKGFVSNCHKYMLKEN